MGLWDQFRRPTGHHGRIVAARMNHEHKKLTTWGLTHVTIAPDNAILDMGCGGGKTVNRLAKQAKKGKVYGIDYSPDMVKYAREVNREFIERKQVEIVEGSVDKTGFPEGFFDLVTACETYYFWPSLPKAFTEIKRVLKPGGKLLMVNEVVMDGYYEVEHAELIEKTHVRLFPLDEISGMLRSAGFVEVEVFRKDGSAWNAVVAQRPT